MPVEIRELHIKVHINDAGGKSISLIPTSTAPSASDQDLQSSIVAQCVEQVMEILKEKSER